MSVPGIYCDRIAQMGDMNQSNHGPDYSYWDHVESGGSVDLRLAKFSMC